MFSQGKMEMKKDWGSGRGWGGPWEKGREWSSKTHLVKIWRMPLCLTGRRLMTIGGIRGQNTLWVMCMCVCINDAWAYVLIGLSVCLCWRQNMKDGNMAGRGDGGVDCCGVVGGKPGTP